MVCVMPLPLACCALSSNSAGNSTVTLRVFAITHYTIPNTSMEYGIFSSANEKRRPSGGAF
jgi:hypothetical protein